MKAPHVLQMITLRGHSFLPGPIGSDSVVVDLGANRGEFSQRVRARFGCRCYAVEPTPRLFREIEQIPGVRSFNYAINDRDEPVTFHISESEVRSSLLGNLQRATGEHVTVQGRTLESFMAENQLSRINLLKADIEGAEVRLFESTSDQVLKRIDQITIEFHDFCGMMTEEQILVIRQRLERLGFDEMRFDGNN